MNKLFKNTVETEEELRMILGYPSEIVARKSISFIDHHCRDFISKSPIIFISTSDKEGLCEVSPRGDLPGFVTVFDDNHLIIPERPGNRRCDSIINIISNPHIGIVFIIPGLEETLRVNGKAFVIKDEEILQQYELHGKVPKLAIITEVEECYIHCAKAFKRSKVWEKESWLQDNKIPIIPKILADHVNLDGTTHKEISEALKESYSKRLY